MYDSLNNKIISNLSTKNSKFLLSIVIPTFNRQNELIQLLDQLTIELVGVQNEVEVLISNNNSCDQTWRVLQEYMASKTDKLAIRCFTQASNIGAPMNLHFLIKHCRAKYTWAMGDDDLLVSGRLHEIVGLLHTNSVGLLLIRADGVGEWDRILSRPIENCNAHLRKVNLHDENSADYLFAGGFLGSVIINTNTWKNVLPQVEELHETCYANWAAVLKVATMEGEYYVIDEPCVKGNFNMRGECLIPGFGVLIAGRLKIWSTFTGEPIQKILSHEVKELAYMGWALIALGRVNDVVTLSDKIHALRVTISLLGVQGFKAYFFAFISIVFPFTSVLRRIQMVASSYLKVKK